MRKTRLPSPLTPAETNDGPPKPARGSESSLFSDWISGPLKGDGGCGAALKGSTRHPLKCPMRQLHSDLWEC